MSPKLKQSVKQFYSDKTLSDSQLDQLNSLIREYNEAPQKKPGHPINDASSHSFDKRSDFRFSIQRSMLAAIFCISLTFLIFFLQPPHSASVQDIATEVAANHRHLKPLVIQSGSFQQLASFFSELNFKLKPSSLLNQQRWKLLGGRYCSVNGLKAAQLRLLDTQNNSIQTFYQVEHQAKYFENIPEIDKNELPLSVSIDGVPVVVWSEGGILYSLTHSPAQ